MIAWAEMPTASIMPRAPTAAAVAAIPPDFQFRIPPIASPTSNA